jgi:regulator of protease activity HflC (stomatin/prohibitin superfamily)
MVTQMSCSSVEPNYRGVLMENFGRNGMSDFRVVTGKQWVFSPGTVLYQVPMFETGGDPEEVTISARDGGQFTVDPSYQYSPARDKGVEIVFNYKHLGVSEPEVLFSQIESTILDKLVINAYREEARNYTTDSLMNNLNTYERSVESRLLKEFDIKFMHLENLTSGLQPPASMARAIEERNNAIQEANKIENELKVSRMRLEKAKIDAEANRVKTTGLSKELLTKLWIEAIKDTKNKVIITDGKTPVILN